MTDKPFEFSADNVITDLVIKNYGLTGALEIAQEEAVNLKSEILKLQEEIRKSVSVKLLAQMIEQQFKDGRVPIPESFRNSANGLVNVTCDPASIHTDLGAVMSATVWFSARGKKDNARFLLVVIPDTMNNPEDDYPDFHMGYTKTAPIKKFVRKTPDTFVHVSDPFPPSGNPS